MTRAHILSVGYNWLTGAVKGFLRPNDWFTWAKPKIFKSLRQTSITQVAREFFSVNRCMKALVRAIVAHIIILIGTYYIS